MKKLLLIMLFWSLQTSCNFCYSQSRELDSLKQILRTAKEDTNKVNLLNDIGWKLVNFGKYDSSLFYTTQAKDLAMDLNFKKSIGRSYNTIAICFFYKGNYDIALKNYFASLKIREEVGDERGVAACYANIGSVYILQNNDSGAIKNFRAALSLSQKTGYKPVEISSYGNLGSIYLKKKNYAEALKNQQAALKISEETGEKNFTAACYGNIGSIYLSQSKNETKSNYDTDLLNKALTSFSLALGKYEEIGNKRGIAISMVNMSDVYGNLKQLKQSEEYSLKALKLAEEIGALETIKSANKNLSDVYMTLGRYKEAIERYKAFVMAKDSLINEANTKKTIQQQMQYEFDKKEATAKLIQEKKDGIAQEESRKQKIIIYSVSGGLGLILILAAVILRSLLVNRKKNKIITAQKEQVEKQKELVEEKQKEILDSIHYARRIQQSLLPSERYVENRLKKLTKGD